MHSASFRVLSTIIWLLLLFVLVLVIALVVRDNPPSAQSPSPSTEQQTSESQPSNQTREEYVAVQPTFTSTPYVIQSASVPLLDTKRILAGGYSFRPIDGYEVLISDGSVTMSAPNADEDIGPTMLLIGGAESSLIKADTRSTEDAFEQFVSSFAQYGDIEIGDKVTVNTQRLSGIAANLSNPSTSPNVTKPFSGRIFLTRPTPPQYFVLVAIAPSEIWESSIAEQFDAVLDTVALFRLTDQFGSLDSSSETTQSNTQPETNQLVVDSAPRQDEGAESIPVNQQAPREVAEAISLPQSFESEDVVSPLPQNDSGSATRSSQRHTYTNGNFVNEAIVVNDLVWAATDGGVVAWNQNSGSASKFTTADGLLSNQTNAVTFCEFAELGIVFGTSAGLQIFNIENGRWSTLTSENSLMSFDDVSDLYCDSIYGFMVIGYERHGVDIFDATSDEWLHLDRNRALVSNVVRQLVVVGDRQEIWIASDLGLTILENIPEPTDRRSFFFNKDNSPLRDLPLDALTKGADGTVWLAQENTLYRVRKLSASVAGSTQRDWETFTLEAIDGDAPLGPIRALAPASTQTTDKTIWVGTQGRDICRFDPVEETCVEFFDDQNHTTSNEASGALTHLFKKWPQDNSELFFTTQGNGISHFDGSNWKQLALDDEPVTSNHIQHLAQSTDGTLWIATSAEIQLVEKGSSARSGLAASLEAQRIRQGNRSLFDSVQRGEPVTALWADDDGSIWLGTDNADFYNGADWRSYTSVNGLVGSPVQSFAVDNQKRVWIGTGSGLNVLNEETFFSLTEAQGLPDDNIQVLLAEPGLPENVVWIGTAEGGLLRFEKNQLAVFDVENANLPSNTITALALDADGSLLVGTDRGLARLTDGEATTIRAIGDMHITALETGPSLSGVTGTMLWVGTETSGLFHYNGLAWEQLSPFNLPNRHITALLLDDDGTLWIGGVNGGLVQYEPNE